MNALPVAPGLIRGLIAAPEVPGQARDTVGRYSHAAPDLIRGLSEALK